MNTTSDGRRPRRLGWPRGAGRPAGPGRLHPGTLGLLSGVSPRVQGHLAERLCHGRKAHHPGLHGEATWPSARSIPTPSPSSTAPPSRSPAASGIRPATVPWPGGADAPNCFAGDSDRPGPAGAKTMISGPGWSGTAPGHRVVDTLTARAQVPETFSIRTTAVAPSFAMTRRTCRRTSSRLEFCSSLPDEVQAGSPCLQRFDRRVRAPPGRRHRRRCRHTSSKNMEAAPGAARRAARQVPGHLPGGRHPVLPGRRAQHPVPLLHLRLQRRRGRRAHHPPLRFPGGVARKPPSRASSASSRTAPSSTSRARCGAWGCIRRCRPARATTSWTASAW